MGTDGVHWHRFVLQRIGPDHRSAPPVSKPCIQGGGGETSHRLAPARGHPSGGSWGLKTAGCENAVGAELWWRLVRRWCTTRNHHFPPPSWIKFSVPPGQRWLHP